MRGRNRRQLRTQMRRRVVEKIEVHHAVDDDEAVGLEGGDVHVGLAEDVPAADGAGGGHEARGEALRAC